MHYFCQWCQQNQKKRVTSSSWKVLKTLLQLASKYLVSSKVTQPNQSAIFVQCPSEVIQTTAQRWLFLRLFDRPSVVWSPPEEASFAGSFRICNCPDFPTGCPDGREKSAKPGITNDNKKHAAQTTYRCGRHKLHGSKTHTTTSFSLCATSCVRYEPPLQMQEADVTSSWCHGVQAGDLWVKSTAAETNLNLPRVAKKYMLHLAVSKLFKCMLHVPAAWSWRGFFIFSEPHSFLILFVVVLKEIVAHCAISLVWKLYIWHVISPSPIYL